MSTSSRLITDTVLPKRQSSNPGDTNQATEIQVRSVKKQSQTSNKRLRRDLGTEFRDQLDDIRLSYGLLSGKKDKRVPVIEKSREVIVHYQKNGKEFRFPVYTEKELGFDSKLEKYLNQPYEEDDDIDTRNSVVSHFVNVCKRDLLEAIRMQKLEQEKENRNPDRPFSGFSKRADNSEDESSD